MNQFNLIRSPEIKKFFIKSIIILLVLLMLSTLAFIITDKNLRSRFLQRDIAAASMLSEIENPDQYDVIYALNNSADVDSNEVYKILNSIGLNEKAYSDSIFGFNHVTTGYYLAFILLLLFSFTIFFVTGFIALHNNLSNAVNVSDFTAKALIPEFNDSLSENNEGVFATLNHNINMLVKRQLSTSENLLKEKVFLQNLVSDISHQMKTPLSSLILNNELLTKKYPDNEFLAVSRGQLDRMEVLVINLLKYARLEADSVIFVSDREDMSLTIKNAMGAVKTSAKIKNISIIYYDENNPAILHDGNWLEEAIINILKNAVEHTPTGGSVSITYNSTGISDNIIIEDTGPGIPVDEMPHIFDRFYKGKAGTNPSNIGIGLSLCRLIVEGLGGTVRAENPDSGGARFIISFPTF